MEEENYYFEDLEREVLASDLTSIAIDIHDLFIKQFPNFMSELTSFDIYELLLYLCNLNDFSFDHDHDQLMYNRFISKYLDDLEESYKYIKYLIKCHILHDNFTEILWGMMCFDRKELRTTRI